jgi:hypothetical protein
MSMTPEQLRDYRNWYELTAKEVLDAVREIKGGWGTVFNKGIPCWASRLRNYFNVTPKFLMRFGSRKEWEIYHTRLVNREFMAWHALHGAVYKDKQNREWLQMATAAAVYHYQGEVTVGKEIGAHIRPQMMMPIFKLVSPDRTGGSREVILTNPKGWLFGDSTVATDHTWEYVRGRVVLQETYAGSYNYAETITRGYDAHKAADVKTHRTWPGFYINPDPDSKLEDRGFPERDGRGALLHTQINYVSQAVKSSPKRTNIIPRGLAASHLKPVANPDLDPSEW